MDKINVRFDDGTVRQYDKGTTLLTISRDVAASFCSPIVAVQVNNEIKHLQHQITTDCSVSFSDMSTSLGMKVYQRSLIFVMLIAAHELFPTGQLFVEHSLGKGLYCELRLGRPLTSTDISALQERMRQIAAEKRPIEKRVLPADEAVCLFRTTGQETKAKLIEQLKKKLVTIYCCGDYCNYFYRTLVPDTSYLTLFELRFYPPGFVLRYPLPDAPASLPSFVDVPKLAEIFLEAERWAELIGCDYIPSLNERIAAGEINDIVRISEALHEKKLAQIADYITARRDTLRIVVVAGPSSSGKTTFVQRLGVQLHVNGLVPLAVSMDDYFFDRDEITATDLESIDIVDLDLLNRHLAQLLNGEAVELPRFNFHTGDREFTGKKVQLKRGHVLLVEGIHGLNVRVAQNIPRENKVKIYINALTQLAIDQHNRIPTTDARLIRRLVRDSQFRSHSAAETLRMWASVLHGEEGNIFPFGEEADLMFNSALLYEQTVLKKYAIPLLRAVPPDQPEYSEARRLIRLLGFFYEAPDDIEIPFNSILREFIGKS